MRSNLQILKCQLHNYDTRLAKSFVVMRNRIFSYIKIHIIAFIGFDMYEFFCHVYHIMFLIPTFLILWRIFAVSIFIIYERLDFRRFSPPINHYNWTISFSVYVCDKIKLHKKFKFTYDMMHFPTACVEYQILYNICGNGNTTDCCY